MIFSMTGYSHHESTVEQHKLSCELHSLNHRFLELRISLPEQLSMFNPAIRKQIGNKIKRGKVDCNIRYQNDSIRTGYSCVDTEALTALINFVKKLNNELPFMRVNPLELIKWPGILNPQIADLGAIEKILFALVDESLDTLMANRQIEGQKLEHVILSHCMEAEGLLDEIKRQVPCLIETLRQKLVDQIEDLKINCNPERLEQELFFFLQKTDLTEEIDRLDAHIDETKRLIQDGTAPVGKHLDFLAQEMNREANTIASKTLKLSNKNIAINLKVLIEKIREQIQNVE